MEAKSKFAELKTFTKEEIEAQPGKYDKDGFYILKDGDFYDDQGYYFDKDGYDENGGFYDEETGEYVPPPENDDFADYYDELCGSDIEEAEASSDSSDDEDDGDIYTYVEDDNEKEANYDYQVDEKEATKGIRREHCIPALEWLKGQPADKKHVIKIANVPRRATQEMMLRMLQKKIKGLKYDKYGIEKNDGSKINNGVAYISTTDHATIAQLLKLHYHVSIFPRKLIAFHLYLDLCRIQAAHISYGVRL